MVVGAIALAISLWIPMQPQTLADPRPENGCGGMRLDAPGGPLEHLPVMDQGPLNICYAYTATELADAWRLSHGHQPRPEATDDYLGRACRGHRIDCSDVPSLKTRFFEPGEGAQARGYLHALLRSRDPQPVAIDFCDDVLKLPRPVHEALECTAAPPERPRMRRS
jgi:hypothetical protein